MSARIIMLELPRRIHLHENPLPWPSYVVVAPAAGVELLSAVFATPADARRYAEELGADRGWPLSSGVAADQEQDGGVAA